MIISNVKSLPINSGRNSAVMVVVFIIRHFLCFVTSTLGELYIGNSSESRESAGSRLTDLTACCVLKAVIVLCQMQ